MSLNLYLNSVIKPRPEQSCRRNLLTETMVDQSKVALARSMPLNVTEGCFWNKGVWTACGGPSLSVVSNVTNTVMRHNSKYDRNGYQCLYPCMIITVIKRCTQYNNKVMRCCGQYNSYQDCTQHNKQLSGAVPSTRNNYQVLYAVQQTIIGRCTQYNK